MKRVLSIFVMLAWWGLCAPAYAQNLFPLQIIGGNVQVAQSLMQVLYPQYPDLTYTYTLTLPQAVTIGDAVFGGALFEPNVGNGTTAGSLDTVMVGTERAIIDDVGSQCCGPAIITFHLLNVNNPATTITYSSSTQGNFINEDEAFAEISGLSSSAAIDVHTAQYEQVPAGGLLTSGTVTPSVSGDFLFGVGFKYDAGEPPLNAGSGWTIINNCATAPAQCTNFSFDPAQEYQVYNATDPVAATFQIPNQTDGGGESWAGVIAVKLQ